MYVLELPSPYLPVSIELKSFNCFSHYNLFPKNENVISLFNSMSSVLTSYILLFHQPWPFCNRGPLCHLHKDKLLSFLSYFINKKWVPLGQFILKNGSFVGKKTRQDVLPILISLNLELIGHNKDNHWWTPNSSLNTQFHLQALVWFFSPTS